MAGQIAQFVRLNPAAGALVFVALLCLLILGLKIFSKRYAQHPELLRKLVHIGIGLTTLTFPWLFAAMWPVASIAVVSAALLMALKVPGPLRNLMGGVVDGVDRSSYGDLSFPIGVVTLFWLSQSGDAATSKLLFCVPVLLLTLGDAVAALVGVKYGRHKFSTAEGMKSVEGSLACFAASFLCTLLPLIAFARIGHVEALLLAMILALVAMMLEAIAWSGLDNLFLPLGGYALLKTHLGLSLKLLLAHAAATVALFLFALAWRRRTSLNDSAVLGAALYGYCAWSIGGPDWVYAPLFLFVGYPLMWPRTWRDAARTHTIGVVLAVGAAGLAWLFLFVALQWKGALYAYNVAFAAQMAMIGLARLRHRYTHMSGVIIVPTAIAVSWLLLIAPTLFASALFANLVHFNSSAAFAFSAATQVRGFSALAGIAVAAILFDRLRRDLRDYPCDPARWRLQAALGALGSIVGVSPMLWGY